MSGFSSSPFEEKGNHYSVAVDMNYFHPSEMSVKVIDNTVVVVEAKHKERADDQYGCISRHFLHRYRLPTNVDPTSITSDLSDKGILTVTAKKVYQTCGNGFCLDGIFPSLRIRCRMDYLTRVRFELVERNPTSDVYCHGPKGETYCKQPSQPNWNALLAALMPAVLTILVKICAVKGRKT